MNMNEGKDDGVIIEGFRCYAPHLAYQSPDYPFESLEYLFRVEDTHFWFRGRNLILRYLFARYVGRGSDKRVMEVGAGNGCVLKAIQPLGYKLTGTELSLIGLRNIRRRLPDIELTQLSALDIPFRNAYDAIGIFDVIEHIEEDERVLSNLHQALKPGGYLLITVPQYQFLWSYEDEFGGHKRRYTRKDLRAKLERQGFQVCYISSFVFMLFPFVLLSRLAKKRKSLKEVTARELRAEFELPPWLNALFYQMMKVDYFLIRVGLSLPWGSSLVCVCQKRLGTQISAPELRIDISYGGRKP